MALIRRDPFAREEMHRVNVRGPLITIGKRTCDWCGQVSRLSNGEPRLFAYRTERDGGSTHEHKGLFCSVGCHDTYHRY